MCRVKKMHEATSKTKVHDDLGVQRNNMVSWFSMKTKHPVMLPIMRAKELFKLHRTFPYYEYLAAYVEYSMNNKSNDVAKNISAGVDLFMDEILFYSEPGPNSEKMDEAGAIAGGNHFFCANAKTSIRRTVGDLS